MFTGLNKPYSLRVEQRTSLNRKEACLLAGAESVVSGLLEHFVEVLEWGGPGLAMPFDTYPWPGSVG